MTAIPTTRLSGKCWRFGDNINTDLIMPGRVYDQPEAVQVAATFADMRPGFSKQVAPGDVIVAGRNFGTGSSRPAARSLVRLGIACLAAEKINGLFLRNCVNFGLLAVECPGVTDAFAEGDTAGVDLDTWTITNLDTGARCAVKPVPPRLLALMVGGGVFPTLERDGWIVPIETPNINAWSGAAEVRDGIQRKEKHEMRDISQKT
ncbi:3-isopropylmalate dehydratase [Paraburkholderia sp.]|uniref:LeuD/DmdB family oxidoreductase small subunit n=1 Tax=Paraburkholderia sp. TaxID=1926495 RepID=UPI0039E3025A